MKAPKQHSNNTIHHDAQPFIQRMGKHTHQDTEVPFISRQHLPPTIQPKLKIGAPNDPYEQEADQMAERVSRMPMEDSPTPMINRMRQPSPPLQRQCADCDPTLQRMTMDSEMEDTPTSSESIVQRKCKKCTSNATPTKVSDRAHEKMTRARPCLPKSSCNAKRKNKAK